MVENRVKFRISKSICKCGYEIFVDEVFGISDWIEVICPDCGHWEVYMLDYCSYKPKCDCRFCKEL